MVTSGGFVVGLPTKKLARVPSKNKNAKLDKNGNPNTMKAKNALREMMTERASASNDRDPSLAYLNKYWSQYTDENSGEMLTSGEAINAQIEAWAEQRGKHYTMKKKNKEGEVVECDAYRPLRQDAIVAFELAVKVSVESFLRIPEQRREEFLEASIEWAQENYTVAAYAVHYDEGYKDEGEQYKEALQPSGLWVNGYIRVPHIQFVLLAVDGEGEFVGQHLFDKKGQTKKEKSYFDFMQERGFDVVDNRNFKPERIDEEIEKLVSQGVDEVTATQEARKLEYERSYATRKAKQDARNEYGVKIPLGAPRNQFGELSREQARRRLLDIEAQEDFRKGQLEQYTASVEAQAKDRYREIVDKGKLDAARMLKQAKEKVVDYDLQGQQMLMRSQARCEEMEEQAKAELYEAERKRKQADAQDEENKRVSSDLTAAITKYNEDRAALDRDRAALEQEKARMREDISLGQKYRAQQLAAVDSYSYQDEEEARVKVEW